MELIEPNRIYIAQGERATGGAPGLVISTILGSCVATCLWDPAAGIGGMNHFLLPEGGGATGDVSSFGVNAMELLVNALLKEGADRRLLRAKVFGGAELTRGLTNAGHANGLFVKAYLAREEIPVDGESLGGARARRVEFWPATGRARQRFVHDGALQERPAVQVAVSDLEMF